MVNGKGGCPLAKDNLIAALDLGTSSIRVIVGEPNSDKSINIIGVGTSSATGVKKGAIVDLDRTINSIADAVAEAERMVGEGISSVYIGIAGTHAGVINNRGVVAVAGDDKEITREDVSRVMQASRVMALPPDREIVDIVAKEYIVDGYDGIRDPVGMIGIRLEVEALIITGMVTTLRNTIRCVERAGLDVNGLVLNPLADAEVALTRDDRELGVVLLNIGAGTCEISVFQEGTLQNVDVIPIGGDHITNDIAVVFRTTLEEAEKIKLAHGSALRSEADSDQMIEIHRLGKQKAESISQLDLVTVIEPRVTELLQMANQKVEEMGYQLPLPAGVVLTGGTSQIPGLLQLSEEIFRGPARIITPKYVGVKTPSFTTGVGIINYVQRMNMVPAGSRRKVGRMEGFQFFSWLRNWFMGFLE